MCIGGITVIKELLQLFAQHQILIKSKPQLVNMSLPRPETDNRELKGGECFIAIKGEKFDGHSFVDTARKSGAKLVIGEYGDLDIQVKDSRKAAALYAKVYFDDPGSKLILYGVTGTNGKTTSSLMMYQMLIMRGVKAAWIGTLGYKIMDHDFPTKHTTPDIMQLNNIFVKMIKFGVSHVVMEVSSHALALDRVYGIDFDYCLFTNLSRDHLDFHRDMDDYFETKYRLFERAALTAGKSIVNIDDAHGKIIQERLLAADAQPISIGQDEAAELRIVPLSSGIEGSSFDLLDKRSGAAMHISSSLIGDFNIDNLALACAAMLYSGATAQELPQLCHKLQPVRGRIEPVQNSLGLGVFVDYAHSPDALSNLLKSLNKLPHRRMITVFGAGGDRDQGKRPLMLQAALRNCDVVIITDDNPRHESPQRIIYDIVKDTDYSLPWWIIRDRREAIMAAIRLAQPQDIVVICGKGHESYQEIEGVRYEFDDLSVANEALSTVYPQKAEDELVLPVDPLMLRLLNKEEPSADPYRKARSYRYVSTDSRNIKKGSIFFAIKGDNFDGNRYIPEVLEDNLAVGIHEGIESTQLIECEQAELLMAALLKKYLQIFPLYKIALTGSTGKTGTKEILAQILSSKARTLKTQRNENNIIGLCKTILRVEAHDQYGVFEIGTNHFGEIALLADTIVPDAGIILNIGPSHLEYFGDEEGVFREKSELFHRALGHRIFPADDSRFDVYKDRGTSVGYNETADYLIHNVNRLDSAQSFMLGKLSFTIPYEPPHFVINSAFCIAMALELGFEPETIQAALSQELDIDMRMQIQQVADKHLIVDCYNANPVSMQSAIEYWRDYQPTLPHVAFLGDMLELGESAELYHRMIGAILVESGDHTIYSVGPISRLYQTREDRHYDDVSELTKNFPNLPEHAVILIKASHGIHLEKILPLLRGEI